LWKAKPIQLQLYKGRVKIHAGDRACLPDRQPAKERAELRLVQRAFELIPHGRVLDAPCGGGRVTLLLAKRVIK